MGRSMGGSSGGSRGGGGGRSMGGGSRSVSRSFSGSGRSGVGSSGSHRSMGSSSSYHSSSSHNSYNHNNYHHHNNYNSYNSGYNNGYRNGYNNGYHNGNYYGGPRGPRRSSGCGCGTLVSFIVVLIIVAAFLGIAASGGTEKKLNRPKYTGDVDSNVGYYVDNSDASKGKFIDGGNETTLISGFKNFYSRTGVHPFLYVSEDLPSAYSTPQQYTDALYEELFKTEGNLLVLYIAENDDYYYAAGYNVGEVIDEESLNMISRRVNSHWDSGDLAEAFGKGLDEASKNIMAKSNARVIMITIIIAVAAIIIVLILYKWWQKRVAQKNKEQEDLERTLNTPLETFGETPIDALAQKYEDKN